MSTLPYTTARIQFLGQTWDEQGQIVHHSGEVIVADLVGRKQDFLLVRTAAGAYMYLDVSRCDLYNVELQGAAA